MALAKEIAGTPSGKQSALWKDTFHIGGNGWEHTQNMKQEEAPDKQGMQDVSYPGRFVHNLDDSYPKVWTFRTQSLDDSYPRVHLVVSYPKL